ncbi:hypothetical protein K1719_032463 [Acacia pycnantha]|nr:hypothetical protein K1719_032463 [Acacia pycnantha]
MPFFADILCPSFRSIENATERSLKHHLGSSPAYITSMQSYLILVWQGLAHRVIRAISLQESWAHMAMLLLYSYSYGDNSLLEALNSELDLYTLARRYILESPSFELFFKFLELPTFDVASDAFSTFKDLLTKHGKLVSEILEAHYDEADEFISRSMGSSPKFWWKAVLQEQLPRECSLCQV